MYYFFKINNLGTGLGPYFVLYDNLGYEISTKFSRQQLLNGVNIQISDGATTIYVKSTGDLCKTCETDAIAAYQIPESLDCPDIPISTTTQAPPPPPSICFAFVGENIDSGSFTCTVAPESELYNGRQYYIGKNPDCTTPWTYTPTIAVWFNTAAGLYQNKWVFGPLGNLGDIILYLNLETPPDLPVGFISETAPPTVPPINSGKWEIGPQFSDDFYVGYSLPDCPPSICFVLQIEGDESIYANFPIGTSPATHNGKVWYGDSNGRCIYWNSSTNAWVYDFDGLDGGAIYGSLDNNNNDFPISDSTYQWDPGCEETVEETMCSSEATTCPENICFGIATENTGGEFTPGNISPQPNLINGKVWYKGQLDFGSDYYYIYWDNTNTYVTGGTWVAGASPNGSLTPPINPTDVWYYSGTTGNYPSNCAFNCIPATPWNSTGEGPDGGLFAVLNRGECPIIP